MTAAVTHAAVLPASSTHAEAEPTSPPAQLAVPGDILAMLRSAVSRGMKDAEEFAASHPASERWLIGPFAGGRLGFPPRSDEADLKRLHEIAKSRTPQLNEAAKWWAKNGLGESWKPLLADYARRHGAAQAKAAEKLLADTMAMVNETTQITKSSSARTRPFVVDPTLELIVEKPGNNPSYPSGHTSAAYAAAIVLSYLMPDRQVEFMQMAEQAAYSRVYAGVHFPTDIEAGAKLAATMAAYMVKIAPQTYGIRPDAAAAQRGRRRAAARTTNAPAA